ncbi:MAG: diadenylate cyclase CdaA [Chloroflexota bacterium]
MIEIITKSLTNLLFIFERFTWLSLVDILLVTLIFFFLLQMLRDTQAMILLRGIVLLIVLLSLLTSMVNLPAFSWLVATALPALLFAVPVIFAPEIRRALTRLGRGTLLSSQSESKGIESTINIVVNVALRLSDLQYGALIVLQRADSLEEYIRTGIPIESRISQELLLQIFFPNTPLHDGAVIIRDVHITAAACVMPLSASGTLRRSGERKMGLRHRAALGISEVSDALALVVSEETGTISIAHGGRMMRRLDTNRMRNILEAFYLPPQRGGWREWLTKRIPGLRQILEE